MTVTVHSEPVGTDDVAAVCSDVALAYDLQANVTAGNGMTSSFSWIAADNANVTGDCRSRAGDHERPMCRSGRFHDHRCDHQYDRSRRSSSLYRSPM